VPARGAIAPTWRARTVAGPGASITGSSWRSSAASSREPPTDRRHRPVGRREIETLYGCSPGRLEVVYNGVDLARFHPANRSRYARERGPRRSCPPARHGSLRPAAASRRKGLTTAIEAFAAFADRESRLVVVGKGDPRPYQAIAARSGSAERVVWLGARSDLERWYAAADIVCCRAAMSRSQRGTMEALAAGLPVVGARAPAGGDHRRRESTARSSTRWTRGGDGGARALSSAARRRGRSRRRGSAEPYTYAARSRVREDLQPLYARNVRFFLENWATGLHFPSGLQARGLP